MLTVAGARPWSTSALPGQDVAAQAGADAVVAVRSREEGDEAVEVQGDLCVTSGERTPTTASAR